MWTLRRVEGQSMAPTLRHGQIIVVGNPSSIQVGTVVVISHNNIDKVKRVTQIKKDQIYITGDNIAQSTDSRSFGWIDRTAVVGTLVWPKI